MVQKLGEEMKEEWESKGGDAMVQDLKDSMNAAWNSMKGWTIGDMLDAMDEAKVISTLIRFKLTHFRFPLKIKWRR
jgi:Mg/Co/Ni transporter MgtE